jgi:hypothetical protein
MSDKNREQEININLKFCLNSRVQHPVARVLIGFINVTTVRNFNIVINT